MSMTGSCTPVPCPSGSSVKTSNRGVCTCDPGYAGFLTFAATEGVYLGSCSLASCPLVPDPVASTAETVEPLPGFASSPPHCTCPNEGYVSSLRWISHEDAQNSTYLTEGWSGRCSVAPFPYGANLSIRVGVAGDDRSSSPKPKCRKGYQGAISWSGTHPARDYGRWEGVCQQVPCPEGSSRPAAGHGHGQHGHGHRHGHGKTTPPACHCKPGFYGDVVWDDASSSWKGQCVGIPCPPYSQKDKGSRNCVCDGPYYEQTLKFDREENRWTGNCTVAASILPASHNTSIILLEEAEAFHGVAESSTAGNTTTTTFQIVLACCSALLVVAYALFRCTNGLACLIPKERRAKGIATAVVRTIMKVVCMARVAPLPDSDAAESISFMEVAAQSETEKAKKKEKKKPKLDALGAARFVASVHVVAGHLVNKHPSKGYPWPTSG